MAAIPISVLKDTDTPFHPHLFETSVQPQLLTRRPVVLITPVAYKKMQLFVDIAPLEVGWMGTVTAGTGGSFLIDQVFLLEQEVTISQTELSTAAQSRLIEQLLASGEDGLRQANNLHFWGHSHVRGRTRPSLTDERTLERFAHEGHPFFIRGIFNKLGRIEFTVCLYDWGLVINDAPWAVLSPYTGKPLRWRKPLPDGCFQLPQLLVPSQALRARTEREIDAKVKEKDTNS